MTNEKHADGILARLGVTFTPKLIGSDCPAFCEDALKSRAMEQVDVYPRKTHIHGKHYRGKFSRTSGTVLTVDFWNSYADAELLAIGSPSYRHCL